MLSKLKPSVFSLPYFSLTVYLSVDTGPITAAYLSFRNQSRRHTIRGSLARDRALPCCQPDPYHLLPAAVGSGPESRLQPPAPTRRASQPLIDPVFLLARFVYPGYLSSLFATLYFPILLKALLFQETCRLPKEQLPSFISYNSSI